MAAAILSWLFAIGILLIGLVVGVLAFFAGAMDPYGRAFPPEVKAWLVGSGAMVLTGVGLIVLLVGGW